MKKLTLLLVTLAAVTVLASLPAVVTQTPETATASAPETAAPEMPILAPSDSCGAREDEMGDLDGAQMACCLDQCQTNFDCVFRCGGQPGQCVMANPCCKECVCQVSS